VYRIVILRRKPGILEKVEPAPPPPRSASILPFLIGLWIGSKFFGDWVILSIQRWLQAPFQMPDGKVKERTKGTPQGGVISPVLANLFLHYAFDV